MSASIRQDGPGGPWVVELPEGYSPRAHRFTQQRRAQIAAIAFRQQHETDMLPMPAYEMTLTMAGLDPGATLAEPYVITPVSGSVWFVSYRRRRLVRIGSEEGVANFLQGMVDLDPDARSAFGSVGRWGNRVRFDLPRRWTLADLDALERPTDVTTIELDLTRSLPGPDHMAFPAIPRPAGQSLDAVARRWMEPSTLANLPQARPATPAANPFGLGGIEVVVDPTLPDGEVRMVGATTMLVSQVGLDRLRRDMQQTSGAERPRQARPETRDTSSAQGPRHTPQAPRLAPDPARRPRRALRLPEGDGGAPEPAEPSPAEP